MEKKKKRPVNDVKRAGPKTHLLLPCMGLLVCVFIKTLLLAILASTAKESISQAGCTTEA